MLKTLKLDTYNHFLKPGYNSRELHHEKPANIKENHRKIRKIYSPSHLSYELMRKASFDAWSYNYINKDELAKAGFYYSKNCDRVECYFCKGVVGYWEHGDRPLLEHEKHFPRCPLVQGALTSNVPLTNGDEEQDDLYLLLNRCLLTSLDENGPIDSYNILQTDSMLHLEKNLAYPHYKLHEKRIYSLTNWPNENVPSIEKIAAAGFFYTGMSDMVLCFCCGGGLFNWSKEDDPWADHKKYYAHCPLVNQGSIINQGSSKERLLINTEISSIVLTPKEEELLIQFPICQKLLSMGLSRHSIKSALKEYLVKYSHLPETLMDSADVVVEWKEKNDNKLHKDETDNISQSVEEYTNTSTNRKKEETMNLPNNKEVEILLLQITQDRLRYTCRRCRTQEIEAIALPCQHFHYCKSCIAKSNVCFSCNKQILKIIYPCISR